MINKLKSLTLNPSNKIYLNIFFIFIFFLILKLPTFDLAIRGDIETYSIIANNYLTGDLTSLLDNKPPFLYLTYILNIFLSKNDLFLFNLLSSIPILIGSLLIYFSCENKNKILAAAIYIFSSVYLIHGGYHLTSEHIVVIPIIISYLLLKDINKKNFIKFLLVGILLTSAVFIRQNISILYIGVTIYLIINYKNFTIINIGFFLLGSFLVTITLVIFFLTINEFNFFIKTFFSPLYLLNDKNIFLNFYTLILFGLHIINFEISDLSNNLKIFNSFSLYFLSFYIFLIILFKEKKMLLIVYIVSLSISIFLSRLPNTHYLISNDNGNFSWSFVIKY